MLMLLQGGSVPPGVQFSPAVPGQYGQRPASTHEYHQTQTIKNQVNLKKKTLRLEPLQDSSSSSSSSSTEFALRFAFDASAPCRVTTFLLATEDPKQGCRIVAAAPGVRPAAYYPKGMDHQFPLPGDVALLQQHRISLQEQDAELLCLAAGDGYPLVIRLEALTEQAAAEGRQLQQAAKGLGTLSGLQMEVGGPLPPWAQAQSTYAKLRRDEEGGWRLQILKQKIWVAGTSYELQEIYGMDSNRLNGSAVVEDVEGRECVICMSAERDTTVLPCRHMCMCRPCAAALKTQTNKCPICREEIESLLHIKIQRRGARGGGLSPSSSVGSQGVAVGGGGNGGGGNGGGGNGGGGNGGGGNGAAAAAALQQELAGSKS
ncbi:zinc finger, C3HC4 type-domain-containing protein [Scenedesmus sp. NREL 46B-D3]|nr:zinc finger, C3HC4 type-domain-containing protein [Scenedesmus sp. NREL 46B-D3]